MPKLYVIAAGGTGARVMQSLTMLLASGGLKLDGYEVVPLLVDFDEKDGDIRRAVDLLDSYTEIHDIMAFDHDKLPEPQPRFFRTPVMHLGYLFGREEHKSYLFDLSRLCEGSLADFLRAYKLNGELNDTRYLLDALYGANLYKPMLPGLKGKSNIASVAAGVIIKTEAVNRLIRSFNPDTDRVVLIGSVYGGAAASVIQQFVREFNVMHLQAQMALVLMMPYAWGPDVDMLHAKTKETIEYFRNAHIFDMARSVYYVGCPDLFNIPIGGGEGANSQHRPADIAEVIAALAVGHFVNSDDTATGEFKFGVNSDLKFSDFLDKRDLYLEDFDPESRAALGTLNSLALALKFANEELCNLSSRSAETLRNLLFRGRTSQDEKAPFIRMCHAFERFYSMLREWLAELHTANLFHNLCLCDPDKGYMEMIIRKNPAEIRRSLFDIFQSDKNRMYFDHRWLLDKVCGHFLEVGRRPLDGPKSCLGDPTPWVFMSALEAATDDAMLILKKYDVEPERPRDRGCFFTTEKDKYTDKYGFVKKDLDMQSLPDGLLPAESPVPSPLSRMYLFAEALDEINCYTKHWIDGFANGQPREYSQGLPPSMALVSEWLDLLEAIFWCAGHNDFELVHYNLCIQSHLMHTHGDGEYERIDTALGWAANVKPLKSGDGCWRVQIYKWRGWVIGGSSPMSMVFTAPGFRERLMADRDFMQRAGGHMPSLFGRDPRVVPLHERSEIFRTYLYSLASDNPGLMPRPVFGFINNEGRCFDSELYHEVSRNPDFRNFTPLEHYSPHLTGTQLMYFTPRISADMTDCLLLSRCYERGQCAVPMVIDEGVSRTKYFDKMWLPYSGKPEAVDISERYLPGTYIKYPYLTADDLLADKIIETDFAISDERFYTASAGDINILLPLKRRFFDYFTVEDLLRDDMLKIERSRVDKDDWGDRISVDLKLPLVNGHTIVLHKEYSADWDVVEAESYERQGFDMALFPFYRFDDDGRNVYAVMLACESPELALTFCKCVDGGVQDLEARPQIREGVSPEYTVRYYHMVGAFDLFEVSLQGTTGVVIPKFERAHVGKSGRTFGVDFGPCYTHIAYADGMFSDIQPLSLGGAEAQSAFLNKTGEFCLAYAVLLKAFVPNFEGVGFPMPSLAPDPGTDQGFVETDLFSKTNMILADLDIVGGYLRDITNPRFSSPYITELLWFMKNKSAVSHGGDKFDVVFVHPMAASPVDVHDIRCKCVRAAKYLRCDAEVSVCPRGTALLLDSVHHGLISPVKDSLIIDISWDATEYVYYDSHARQAYGFSAPFAAMDLFGIDRYQAVEPPIESNLFLNALMYRCPDRLREQIRRQGQVDKALAYVLLRHRDELMHEILGNPQLRQLVLTHFSALVFYAAHIIKTCELDVPETIVVTGLGDLVGRDAEYIVKTVFHYFAAIHSNNELREVKIDVIHPDDGMAMAADGAVLSKNSAGKAWLPSELSVLQVYGYDGMDVYSDDVPVLTWSSLTPELQEATKRLVDMFYDMFSPDSCEGIDDTMKEELQEMFRSVWTTEALDPGVIAMLRDLADQSYEKAKFYGGQKSNRHDPILNNPLFFWMLQNAMPLVTSRLRDRNL